MSGPFTTITVRQFQRMQDVIAAAIVLRAEWQKVLTNWPEGATIMQESIFNKAINADDLLGGALAELTRP